MNSATKGLLVIVCGLFAALFTPAQTLTVRPRVAQAVDNTQLTTLRGNRHPLARPEFDRGAAPADLPMQRMLLVLTRSAEQEAALTTLLKDQQDPSSPSYHRWLTPAQFGQQFGPADQDIQTITLWLQSQGFQVSHVALGRTTIEFSGTAGQVQTAFHTGIHKFVVNGEEHWANAADPQIPIALAPVVAGVNSLHNFPRKPQHHVAGEFTRSRSGAVTAVQPSFTVPGCGGSCYALGPYDFATIYNVLPLWSATPTHIDGTGQTIAIVAETDINPQDVASFRTLFGLPAPNLNIVHDGPDPGILTDGEETESDLDVEWSGAVAMNATIDLVVSASTNSSAGVDLSAEYIIDNNLAPIMSESYSSCELGLGNSGNQYFNQLWQQAASEGITVFVSTGDNGSADCYNPNSMPPAPATFGLAVNGIASTPYNVAVGGTDFNDFTNGSTYWNPTNASSTQASAKGYIPETTWNDTCTNALFGTALGYSTVAETNCNNSQLAHDVSVIGASGGKSNCITSSGQVVSSCSAGYPKPSWQTGAGVPSDGARDMPDVSLFASDGFEKSFYVLCEADQVSAPSCTTGGNFLGVGGTSASAPALAGIMALVDQETGARQGNANYVFYQMATQNPNAFNDVTTGTIAMPCATGSPNCVTANGGDAYGVLSGYSASAGYDLATGLGSVNANNLVTQWENVVLNLRSTATTLILSPSTNPIPHGTAVPFNISVTPVAGSGTPTGQVSIVANVGASGQQDVGDFPLNNGAVSSSTSLLPGGQYNVTAHYGGDSTFAASDSAPVAVNVVLETSNTTLQILSASQNGQAIPFTGGPYGSFVYLRANIGAQSGNGTPTGSANFTDNGSTLAGDPYGLNAEGYTVTPNGMFTFSPGTHAIVASYGGDNSFSTSSSSGTFTITPATTTISAGSSVSSTTTGASVVLNATIASATGGLPPTGSVTFFSGSTQVGSASISGSVNPATHAASALASATTTSIPHGQNSVTAHYSGDNNYSASTSTPIAISILYQTSTTVSASSSTVQQGQSVTFTAHVTTNQTSGPSFTGSAQFVVNGANAGSPVLVSGGQAQFITTSLPLGSPSISANYSGDANYAVSSGTLSESVSGFSISANPSAIGIATPGSSGSTTLTTTGYSGFTGTATLTAAACAQLPAESTCSFTPSSVTLSSTSTTSATTLTISTTAPASAAPSIRNSPSNIRWSSPIAVTTLAVIVCPGILLRRRSGRGRLRWSMAAALMLFGYALLSSGCGGGGGAASSVKDPGTPISTTTVMVTIAINGVQAAAPVVVNVQ